MRIVIDSKFMQNHEALELVKGIRKICSEKFGEEVLDIVVHDGGEPILHDAPMRLSK